MKALSPWSKVWLLVVAVFALTAAVYATPRTLEVEWSWHDYSFYDRLAYFVPVIGVIALYLIRFKGRVMDSTPVGATEVVAQELVAAKHIVERGKGRLTVRLSKSVGVVVSAKQTGQQSQLYYGLKPMLRTRLQVAANVNYDILRRYLAWMTERRLVEVQGCDDGYERVSLTSEGMEAYRKLVQWINEMIMGGSRCQ